MVKGRLLVNLTNKIKAYFLTRSLSNADMAAYLKHFRPIVVSQTASKCTASVIFYHGSGGSADDMQTWLQMVLSKDFSFPHARVIFPSAPISSYTPFGGQPSAIWFDRSEVSQHAYETDSVHSICDQMSSLIETEAQTGIPLNRIIIGKTLALLIDVKDKSMARHIVQLTATGVCNCLVREGCNAIIWTCYGGFSMGGCLALHLGFRRLRQVAGVFCMSGFLNPDSAVYKALRDDTSPTPPLFQCHGGKDSLVPIQWSQDTFQALQKLNVQGQYHQFPDLFHEFNRKQITMLHDWILQKIPDNS